MPSSGCEAYIDLSIHSCGDSHCAACAAPSKRCSIMYGDPEWGGDVSFCEEILHYEVRPLRPEITNSPYAVYQLCDRCGSTSAA